MHFCHNVIWIRELFKLLKEPLSRFWGFFPPHQQCTNQLTSLCSMRRSCYVGDSLSPTLLMAFCSYESMSILPPLSHTLKHEYPWFSLDVRISSLSMLNELEHRSIWNPISLPEDLPECNVCQSEKTPRRHTAYWCIFFQRAAYQLRWHCFSHFSQASAFPPHNLLLMKLMFRK